MINKQAIAECLSRYPLCDGALIAQRGLVVEYCAMGALAKDCGATDSELRISCSTGEDLYDNYQFQLREKFGIESYEQFAHLMEVNDSTVSPLERSKAVINSIPDVTRHSESVSELVHV